MLIVHFLLHVVLMLFQLAQDALQFVRLVTRSRAALQDENLLLRKQLALYSERKAKPRRTNDATRLTLVILPKFFAWKDVMRMPADFLGEVETLRALHFPPVEVRGKLVGFVEHDQIPRSKAELLLRVLVARHLVKPDNQVVVVREGIAAR
jgi:hypothetical protein